MARLKDRQRQIPNGIFFYLPQTKWRSSPGSLDAVADQLGRHLLGNPSVAAQLGWPTDHASLLDRVDAFNAEVCRRMGWQDYITEGGGGPAPVPFRRAAQLGVPAVAAGVGSIADWLGAGGVPVAPELAEGRAAVCAACPKNDPGDWHRFFTVPAAGLIQRQIEAKQARALKTAQDGRLGVCAACLCPLGLKVWTPLKHIRDRMPESVRPRLDAGCWILGEEKAGG